MPEPRNKVPFPLNADQMRDVSEYIRALNDAEESLNIYDEDGKVAGGFRATIKDPIPVYTDARGEKELLGWIKYDEFNYVFTQTEPVQA